MRVRLKGLNRVRVKLASGEVVTYHYAWKGGPRLPGEPGSPEFVDAYNEAIASRRRQPTDTIQAVLDAYQASPAFKDLSPRSRADYIRQVRKIEREFGDFPLAALDDRRTRGEFMAWRDRMAASSRRQADYAFAVLARVLSWGLDRGMISANPCGRAGRVYRSQRVDSIWTADDEANFLATAPGHLHLAILLALWTGQRQGDLLRLTWSAFDGEKIRLRQSKTGARVAIPVGAPLKAALEAARKRLGSDDAKCRAMTILATRAGTAWTEGGFRASWRKACAAAGIVGVTFHDLRGTAVTRLALAGCETAEIATITGHSLRDVGAILDSHYLHRDPRLAESAIRKLERHGNGTELPK